MGRYHRTHVLLEEWQHKALKRMAKEEGLSLSAMLRRILTSHLCPPSLRWKGLQVIAGIGNDASTNGRDHDLWLYERETEN